MNWIYWLALRSANVGEEEVKEGNYSAWAFKWAKELPDGLYGSDMIGFLIDDENDQLLIAWRDYSAGKWNRFGIFNLSDFSQVFVSTAGQHYTIDDPYLDYDVGAQFGNVSLYAGGLSRSLQTYLLFLKTTGFMEVWRNGSCWTHDPAVDADFYYTYGHGGISPTGKYILYLGYKSSGSGIWLLLYEGSAVRDWTLPEYHSCSSEETEHFEQIGGSLEQLLTGAISRSAHNLTNPDGYITHYGIKWKYKHLSGGGCKRYIVSKIRKVSDDSILHSYTDYIWETGGYIGTKWSEWDVPVASQVQINEDIRLTTEDGGGDGWCEEYALYRLHTVAGEYSNYDGTWHDDPLYDLLFKIDILRNPGRHIVDSDLTTKWLPYPTDESGAWIIMSKCRSSITGIRIYAGGSIAYRPVRLLIEGRDFGGSWYTLKDVDWQLYAGWNEYTITETAKNIEIRITVLEHGASGSAIYGVQYK